MQATKAELFWNSGKSTPAPLSGVRGVLDYKVTQSDGAKLCKIQTEEIIGAGDKTRDLNNNHHLLLAGGPYSAGTLGYHVGNKVATPLYLTRTTTLLSQCLVLVLTICWD